MAAAKSRPSLLPAVVFLLAVLACLTTVVLLEDQSGSTAQSLGGSAAHQSQPQPFGELRKRADPDLTGYLGAFFLGADPYVYFYISNGNNAVSFKALNRGQPVVRPTRGTGGVRDPMIVTGGGAEAGRKWYIIGTDLNIGR